MDTKTCKEWKSLYIWSPPLVIADVALEECMKAIHKRTDAIYVFVIPRLYSPLWTCMFYKVSDFVFHLSPGSRARTSLHWHFSSLDFQEPLNSTKNAVAGETRAETAPSAAYG